jgi:metallophosphoesterase (TIGR00282 family)
MKILLIGDVFAKPGRKTLAKILPTLKEERKIDFVVANAENLHHGKGVSDAMVRELQGYGVDAFTGGNHIWKVAGIVPLLDQPDYPLIRPANYPIGTPGRSHAVMDTAGKDGKVAVINLMGRVFMSNHLDDPFRAADAIIEKLKSDGLELGKTLVAIVVDFHAEAGSEKMALAHYLDGRVTAVCGTHTHIQTADEQILPAGTAYISDLGMTGTIDSIIGVKKEIIIEGFLKQLPVRHEVAEGQTRFGALLVETDQNSGLATKIERIQIAPIGI